MHPSRTKTKTTPNSSRGAAGAAPQKPTARGPRCPRRLNRGGKALSLVGDNWGTNDFALRAPVRGVTAYLWAAWDHETAREIEYHTESFEYLCHRAQKRREEKAARRRTPWQPPPPHRLNDVEARRYRTLVLVMLQADAPDLPAVLFGVVEAYLGEHTPGEDDPGPDRALTVAHPPRRRHDGEAPRLWRAWSYDDDDDRDDDRDVYRDDDDRYDDRDY